MTEEMHDYTSRLPRRHWRVGTRCWDSSQYAAAQAGVTIRQGYQTNMWGMPTYYLMRSGLLEKRGLKFEEFAVPSGNLTMQQMVARQVDLGTYAGQSFIIGHDKGGLVALVVVETVGRTARVMSRKDLNITKIEDLKGKKIANQTGSSLGNIFVDQLAPKHGLPKGTYQEVRMNVNDMIAAMSGKTVDAMVNTEPYNTIAEADGIATTIMDYSSVDSIPVFMAATPDFVEKNPAAVVAYLQAWREVGSGIQEKPREGVGHDLRVLHVQGLQHVQGRVQKGARHRRRRPRLAGRPRSLHAEGGRGAAARKEDRGDPGLEEGAASGLLVEGQRLTAADLKYMTGPAFARRLCVLGPPLTLRNALKVLTRRPSPCMEQSL